MGNRVVGQTLTAPEAGDYLFIERNGELRELLASAIGINHISEVSDVDGVKSYQLWRDIHKTVPFGEPIKVHKGIDGSGNMIPDYTQAKTYGKYATVISGEDGLVYRALQGGTKGIAPIRLGVKSDRWEVVNLGGMQLKHDADRDYTTTSLVLRDGKLYSPMNNITASQWSPVPFVEGRGLNQWYSISEGYFQHHSPHESVTKDSVRRYGGSLYQANSFITANISNPRPFVEGVRGYEWRPIGTTIPVINVRSIHTSETVHDGREYYVNTIHGNVVLTVPDTINAFTITDYQESWTDVDYLELDFGKDQIRFRKGQQSQMFRIIRSGEGAVTHFRVYDAMGKCLAVAKS